MFYLSWQITLAALILLPVFLIPARIVGRHLGSLTKEGYNLNSEMNMVMQERFNVGGAMLVKLLGRPEVEAESFDAKAGRVRDIGIAAGDLRPGLPRGPDPHRLHGHRHRLRLRRRRRRPGHPRSGHGRGA